jgi:hypothetical protein
MEVNGKKYFSNVADVSDNIMNHVFNGPKILSMYNETLNEKVGTFENPGVRTVIVYGSMENTEKSYLYEKDPKEETKKEDQFYFPEKTFFAPGDGVVLSNSAIVPGLKWAWEFENKLENSKPVKLVDYCSFNQQSYTVYETRNENDTFSFE